MNTSTLGAGLFTMALFAAGGDLGGPLVVTKQLSKKTVTTVVYTLRGATPAAAHAQTEPVNEFLRVVVWLEGGPSKPKAPVTVTINQKSTAFDPDMLVIP